MTYQKTFLLALFFTLLAEIPVVFISIKYFYKNENIKNIVFAGVVSSSLTLPYFWFVLPVFISDRMMYVLIGEVSIVFIEAFIYFHLLKLKFSQALVVSFVANIASILAGLIIM